MTATLPAPARNLTATGLRDRATDLTTSTTVRAAVGDFTGGASEDLFTLTSHGLTTGTMLHVLWQSAMGAVTGGEGLRCFASVLSSSTFQLLDADGDIIENTADGTVAFLSGDVDSAMVQLGIIPNIVAGSNDFTGGTVEDMVSAGSGTHGLVDGDTLKLLFKSDAGAAAVAVDATVFCKSPVVAAGLQYFQTSLTSGGAVADTTGDGTVIFLKTS